MGPVRSPRLIVFTEAFDPHVDHVAPELEARGVDWWRVSLHRFPQEMTISLHSDGGAEQLSLEDDLGRVELDDVHAVWYRRTPAPMLPGDLPRDQRQLARGECLEFLDGMWASLGDRRWISFPWATRRAGSKSEQLRRAAALGLKVPRTLFSNDPAAVRRFYQQCGGRDTVVFKTHQPIIVPHEGAETCGVVYSSLLNENHLERLDEISCCPGIFQEYVPKHHEVRVTIIGERVFACRIFSQEREGSRVDWRNWDWCRPEGTLPRHEACELPAALATTLVSLVRGYDLSFAGVDLLVTPGGDWVFLELNPNGQWAWMEPLVGLPLTQALVDHLVQLEV